MEERYSPGSFRQEVVERKAEIRRELVLRAACGGPDFLEQEEELLDELAALEHGPGGGSSVMSEKSIGEVSR